MKDVAVVIPIYKEQINLAEMFSLKRCRDILSKYDIIYVAPDSLNVSVYSSVLPKARVTRFSNWYFASIDSYNQLMLSELFYERFTYYNYILIYQLDALVFEDELEYFCKQNYDFIGAPWNRLIGSYFYDGTEYASSVGNGGFSLRRVDSCKRILSEFEFVAKKWPLNEDVFFSHCGNYLSPTFSIAPLKVAAEFSLETNAEVFQRINDGKIPFGCHKWELYCGDYYSEVFNQLGMNSPIGLKNDDRKLLSYFLYRKALIRFKDLPSIVLPGGKARISLYGFGNEGENIYRKLISMNLLIDKIFDRGKAGEFIDNIKISESAECVDHDSIILVSSEKYEEEICRELSAHGLERKKDYFTLYDLMFSKEEMQCLIKEWWYE